jgi:hypothetical protein
VDEGPIREELLALRKLVENQIQPTKPSFSQVFVDLPTVAAVQLVFRGHQHPR